MTKCVLYDTSYHTGILYFLLRSNLNAASVPSTLGKGVTAVNGHSNHAYSSRNCNAVEVCIPAYSTRYGNYGYIIVIHRN